MSRLGDGKPIQIVGVAGIGKTEVCKASLKEWLKLKPQDNAYYINIPDNADPGSLYSHIGSALGKNDVDNLIQLLPLLDEGLYYLDNLESIVSTPIGRKQLEELKINSSIRILFSSRVPLDVCFEEPIIICPFSIDEAISLFILAWNGNQTPKKDDEVLQDFIQKKLGCHALTIVLIARLGYSYSLNTIYEQWEKEGAKLADTECSSERLESLQISLRLTSDAICNKNPIALKLWTIAAIFAEKMVEITAKNLFQDEISSISILCKHNILVKNESGYTMLPPLAQYALDEAINEENGFSWKEARDVIYSYFIRIAKIADRIQSTEENLSARQLILFHFTALTQLVKQDCRIGKPDIDALSILMYSLTNAYQFRAVTSRDLINIAFSFIKGKANALKSLGDLERLLGEPEKARDNYNKSIELYTKEQSNLGLANALKSLGDLERLLGEPEKARDNYNKSIELYTKEQSNLGLANALKSLGDLESRLREPEKARDLYTQAIILYKNEKEPQGLALTLLALGFTEAQIGDEKKAIELIVESYKYAKLTHNELVIDYFKGVSEQIGIPFD